MKRKAADTKAERMIKPLTNYPATIPDAVTAMLAELTGDVLDQIAATAFDELDLLHFTVGAAIRNTLGLWDGNWDLLEACEAKGPDEAAGVVLDAVWERLQEKGID
jgi:hypothetical protein